MAGEKPIMARKSLDDIYTTVQRKSLEDIMAETEGVERATGGATGDFNVTKEQARFPRTERLLSSGELTQDGSYGKKDAARLGLAVTSDALSMPLRALTALPAMWPGGEDYGESYARTEAVHGGPVGRFIGNTLRDPATLLTAPFGGAATARTGAGALKAIGGAVKRGAGEGLASALVHQGDKFSQTGEASLKEGAAETALSGLLGGGLEGVGQLARRVPGYAKRSMAAASGADMQALEQAARDPKALADAKAAMQRTKGDLMTMADDIKGRVMSQRSAEDAAAEAAESGRAQAFAQDVGTGRSAYEAGSELRTNMTGTRQRIGGRFGEAEDAILRQSGAMDAPIRVSKNTLPS